jgi:hypothetical protein
MGFVEERVKELRSAVAGADRRESEMPLKSTDEDDPKRLVKIKFILNTCDDGVDYGPDYKKKVAEVPFHRAAGYIRQGRAEAVSGDEELHEIEDATLAANAPEDDGKKNKKR